MKLLRSPIVKHVNSFVVTGCSTRTQNKDEFNEKTAKIPSLWEQFYTSGLADSTVIYGVYSNYDSDANGFYTLTAGIESKQTSTGPASVTIQKGNYLVFSDQGSMPATVVEVWKQVWAFFEQDSDFQRNFVSDFEAYNGTSEVAVYIGIT